MSKNHRRPSQHEDHASEPERDSTEHEQLALLAYRFWQHRGCPSGDPDTDWHKAEHELARQREAAKRL